MTTDKPREVTDQILQQVLHEFGRLIRNGSVADAVCLIYGTGGLPRKLYDDLSEISGVEVQYCGSVLPVWLRWLAFIPSCQGIIKIEDASVLEKVFREIAQSTMVEIMLINQKAEESIVKLVARRQPVAEIHKAALKDRASIIYRLNPDNPASTTGMFDWMYFGDAVPIEVKQRFAPSP